MIAIVVILMAIGILVGCLIFVSGLSGTTKYDYDPIKDEFDHKEVGPPPTNSNSWIDKN